MQPILEMEYARYRGIKDWTAAKVGYVPNDKILYFRKGDIKVCNAENKYVIWGIKDGWIAFIEDLHPKKDLPELVDLFLKGELFGVTREQGICLLEQAHKLRPEVFPSIESKIEQKRKELVDLMAEAERMGGGNESKKGKDKKDRGKSKKLRPF